MSMAFAFLRSAITYLVAGFTTVGVVISLVIHAAFRSGGPFSDRILNAFGKSWVLMSGMRLKVSGLENIKKGTPYIIVANHRSNMDIMTLLTALPIPIRFLSKKEVYKFPLLGAAMRGAQMIPLDRTMGRKELVAIIRGARSLVAEGRSLVVFPEGTRSVTGEMLRFKTGAVHIAAQLGCPVLPVVISGTGAIWPPQSFLIKGGPVNVKVLPPITLNKRAARRGSQVTHEIRQILIEELARL